MQGWVPVVIVKSGQYPEVSRPDGAVDPTTGTLPHKFRACQWAGRGQS
jgi:hypothetical protein